MSEKTARTEKIWNPKKSQRNAGYFPHLSCRRREFPGSCKRSKRSCDRVSSFRMKFYTGIRAGIGFWIVYINAQMRMYSEPESFMILLNPNGIALSIISMLTTLFSSIMPWQFLSIILLRNTTLNST